MFVKSLVVLRDGRITVGGGGVRGNGGYCVIISLPESVREAVEECASNSYSLAEIAADSSPLQAAWIAVHDNRITFADACKNFITSKNCAASLDEWCVAHNMLMEAVKSGEISASRHHDGNIAHWHSELYQHCAAMEIGERCVGFVKSMFKQAEDVGVIAKGQIESLINTIAIRRDMHKDNRLVIHAIYQLFMRQVETDERLRDVFLRHAEMDGRLNMVSVQQAETNVRLNEMSERQDQTEGQLRKVVCYQKVRKITSLVNAIVGCIPVAGAILTNVFSGGASILNDLQVCGLVESVLGIAKDVSGGFGGECLVDRFVERSNEVLSVDEWAKVLPEKKKAVEDAASSLGLTIDELRDKLHIVACMQSGENPCEQVIVEVDGNEQISSRIEGIEAAAPDQDISQGTTTLKVEDAGNGGTGPSTLEELSSLSPEYLEGELKLWKGKGVSKGVIAPLESEEVATCVAAFLVNYEARLIKQFKMLKGGLAVKFGNDSVFGQSLTDVDEEDKKAMLEELASTLAEVTKEKLTTTMRIRLKQFVRFAGQTTVHSEDIRQSKHLVKTEAEGSGTRTVDVER